MKWNFKNETSKKSISNMTLEEFITNTEAKLGELSINNVIEQDATFNACVNYLCNSLASMGLNLHQNVDGRNKAKINNDLADLVKNCPNKNDNGFTLLRKLFFNYFLYGKAIALVKTRKGVVTAIEVLDTSTTTVYRKQNSDQLIIEGYLHDKAIKKLGEECIILDDLTCRYKAIQAVLEAKHKGLTMVTNYFANGGSYVKGILSTASDLSNESKIVLKRAFTKVLQEGSDGVAILDNGLEYKNISQNSTLRESLVNELRSSLDDEIYTIMQVPKSLVKGDGKESSYASLSVIMNSFVKSLMPYCIQLEQEFNRKVLTSAERQQGYYFKMNANKLLRMTPTERANYYKEMVQSGLMSIEECRALEDLPYIEGSDDLLLSLNYVPISKYDEYLNNRYNTKKDS